MSVSEYLRRHYLHFNAASVVEAADGWRELLDGGGKMFLTLAGAMSTAEIGRSLAEMIRAGKVHAISCTGANLEEDLFNLVAHDHYYRCREWRDLTPQQERELERKGLNRVTDVCIPEEEAFRAIEKPILNLWKDAAARGERALPHRFFYRLLNEGLVEGSYQVDPKDSWLVAAAERDLPLFVPGWEDSTLGNIYAARILDGSIEAPGPVEGGIGYMTALSRWYTEASTGRDLGGARALEDFEDEALEDRKSGIGFFQVGGGIAGDFPICAVPMIRQDLRKAVPYWAYFCQISDSTTSYGSYSGALPREKISWGKLGVETPTFLIESDATIVAPLIFALVMGR